MLHKSFGLTMPNACQICDFSFGRCKRTFFPGIKVDDSSALVEEHSAISLAHPAYALNQTARNDVKAPKLSRLFGPTL